VSNSGFKLTVIALNITVLPFIKIAWLACPQHWISGSGNIDFNQSKAAVFFFESIYDQHLIEIPIHSLESDFSSLKSSLMATGP
jgi:hypothetical protein